jgi:hypothetical protein
MASKILSVSIMAFHTRDHYIPYLKEKLGDVPVAMDDGTKGVWNNCKEAWLNYDPEAEWHTVLQDDSIVCNDFQKRAEQILTELNDRDYIVAFYAGNRLKKQINTAVYKGINHVIHHSIVNENALCMRTKHIEQMVKYCEMRGATTDRYIQGFAKRKALPIYSPLPSLIDHRSDRSVYREIYKKPLADSVRHAVWFADNEYDKEVKYDY